MYTLVSALGQTIGANSRWLTLDIGGMSFTELFGLYSSVYASLTNPFYTGKKTFDLNNLRLLHEGSNQTFNDYLISIGDSPLEVISVQRSVSTHYAHYSDAIRANYKIEPISPLGHIDSSILMSDRHWLSVTRENTDFNFFFNHCLVSVNGFIHRTDTDGERLYVVDGMRSARLSGRNNVGITSFADLGTLNFVEIKESMVHSRHQDSSYSKRMYLDLGEVHSGTPMLILGGYLHLLDSSVFSRISDKIFSINFFNLPLKERYFESVNRIDLSSLNLDHTQSNPNRIDLAELYSDEVLLKYATLTQSFIVFIDNESIFTEREPLSTTLIPNTYISYQEPRYPLITGYGKFCEYWRVEEDGQWAVKVDDGVDSNFEFNTTFDSQLICIDDAATPSNSFTYSRAQYLVIGSDFLTTSNI